MINKALFGLCCGMLIISLGINMYFIHHKQLDLAIIFGFLVGAMILNCGTLYGFIKNEELVKKWEGN